MSSDERVSHLRSFTGVAGWLIGGLALAWILFHIITAGVGMLPNYQQRAVHLGGALFLVFLLYRGHARFPRAQLLFIDLPCALACLVLMGYVFVNYDAIVMSNWFVNERIEKLFGIALFLLLLEAVRRTLGWLFVGLIVGFCLYAYFGPYFPGNLGHRGLSLDRMIYVFYLGNNGLLGSLMGISATVVTLFLILGALLNSSGAGDTFIRIAMRLGGHIRGGAGIVAVIGSAFMGMINGSTVANVTSTGVLTIPLMRRLGFNRNLAGSIEAVASTGGQIMPPIMGPGAFLMAELLGIAYLDVVKAALVPSVLFFMALLLGVYLMARRYKLQALPPELIPSRREAYSPLAMINLLVPIGILMFFILQRYTIQTAVFWSIIAIVAMMVLSAIFRRAPEETTASDKAKRAAGLEVEETTPAPQERQHVIGDRLVEVAKSTYQGLYQAAVSVVYIAMIIAAAQIMVSVINMTGFGVMLSQIILSIGGQYLIVSLVLTMMLAVILGMGMPTPAAYAVGAAVLGPPLLNLGFERLPSHLFLYFFASVSAITPPVAAGIFAAIAISGGTFMGTARYALTLACSLFILPFFFIFNPELTLAGDPLTILSAVVSAIIGIAFLSIASIGYLGGRMSLLSRLLVGLGAIVMVTPGLLANLVGVGCIAAGLAVNHYLRPASRSRHP
ncbi:MAG TPA: TRAP transporter fused permease subunit [Halomonas sp.]|nr:TRAP transporter fused permease subunit [Halomonas sp.]